ncbi:hypothetical protein N473_19235 [Pseudoalteromonas luteoviolacea CPMOR-1]|uniref:Uncharacterized protein n=1 Tax=Pseudoalteromonas luteoviolacea CPMOR-1 TaxID=1365248 RepID=A0A167KAS5_9GAMM|nr:hypothetical protein N473_19235 [Pseudoalteromonas luteoviolacea CPMOR-1]
MKKSRCTENQIFAILKEGELDVMTAHDICHKDNVRQSNYHK